MRIVTAFSIMATLMACQSIEKERSEEARLTEIEQTKKKIIVDYLNKGKPMMALRDLRTELQLKPDDVDFLNLMGLTQLALSNSSRAVAALEKAYSIDPKPAIALNLSSALIESGKFDKARSLLNGLLKNADGSRYTYPERIHHNLGLIAERQGKRKLAIISYRNALAENPEFYKALMKLGSLLEKSDKPDLARDSFRKAHIRCPTCFDPVRSLAINLIASKEHEQAIQILTAFSRNKDASRLDRSRAKKLLQETTRKKK